MKRISAIFVCALVGAPALFSLGSKNQRRFVSGNIADKTEAVKEASEVEKVDLAKAALEFSTNYKEILGDDRELSALAVAGIFAIPNEYIEKCSPAEKNQLTDKFLELYSVFSDMTVKIAVLNKITTADLPRERFVTFLNTYVSASKVEDSEQQLLKSVLQTLGAIGNDETFRILFKAAAEKKWTPLVSDVETALSALALSSEKQLLEMIRAGNVTDSRRIFDIVVKNKENPQIFVAEIAENVLARSIYIMENATSMSEALIPLQLDSFNALRELKWTRASGTVVSYFNAAKTEYQNSLITEETFCDVIAGVIAIAPIASVQSLSAYLVALNKQMEEKSGMPSEAVVLALINSLGAVGDKNAFDALLGVTYFDYSDSVIAAARKALANLKW